MKVTLIMPGVGKKHDAGYIRLWQMEPLGIATLAGLTPDDIEIEFFDDRLEDIDYATETDLVAMTVETFTARRAYQIAARFRERDIPVVMGGYHPTLLPEEAADHADAIVTGEAEHIWERVLLDAEKGSLERVYRGDPRASLQGIRVDRSVYRGKDYVPISLVEAGRGCRFSCDFCSITSFFRQTYRPRDPGEVASEIEALDRKTVFLVDDNIVADHASAKRLFRELSSMKIRWIGQGTLSIADDGELLGLMADSGCIGLLIGLESLDRENLLQMGKKTNLSGGGYSEAIRRIRSFGITVYGTFVFGYDHDTVGSFDRAVEFAIRNRFFFAAFNNLTPFPGTPLYGKLESQGRLLYDRWWLDPRCRFGDVVFRPKVMQPEELSQRCLGARRSFYTFTSIFRRLLDSKLKSPSISAAFLKYNIMSGREVDVRQGLPLGEGMEEG